MSADSTARQLQKLLHEERQALTAGRLDRLESVLKRKEALVRRLQTDPPSSAAMTTLHALGLRNQALAQAAQNGIEAVRTRLTSVAEGVSTDTYGKDGVRTDIAMPKRTLARRA